MDVYDERRRQSATRLIDIVEAAVKSGIDIPKGVVEGLNVAMREDARSAANLNPQRFSEKQKINVNSTDTASDSDHRQRPQRGEAWQQPDEKSY